MRMYVLLTILVVSGIALAAYRFLESRKADNGMSFMEFVKNPTSADFLEAQLANRDAVVAELAQESPDKLVAMLKQDADRFGIPARAIEAAGPKVVPALLAAVRDPSFRGGNQTQYGRPVEPLQGVLMCLQEFAPPQAVPFVVTLVDDESEEIRKELALLLGAIANKEASEPLVQLLHDDHDIVRSYAMSGLRRAIDQGRVAEDLARETFDAIVPLVFRRAMFGSEDAPRCLLGLDRKKAIEILSAPDHLRADQENLGYVLAALRDANVRIDDEVLFGILTELQDATGFAAEQAYGEILLTLAVSRSAKGLDKIQASLSHSSQRVRETAAQALALANGLDEPLAVAWEKFRASGWEELSTPQKHALAVRMLIDQVNNGGFSQYFVNSSGDYWRDAMAGLEAIGATNDHRLFNQVIEQLGRNVPSVDRDRRHEQLAVIADADEDVFEEIESEFYDDKYDREVLLLLYILKHQEDFEAKSAENEDSGE